MKNFTKDDLRTGHIVLTKYNKNAILIGNLFKTCDNIDNLGGLANINSYNHDLTHNSLKDFDIKAVYEIVDGYHCNLKDIIKELPPENVRLIWERKREIDWNKVPKFTKVQVRDGSTDNWENAYFIRYNDDKRSFQYQVTFCDRFTYSYWDYCYSQIKIFDESEIKEEWYK